MKRVCQFLFLLLLGIIIGVASAQTPAKPTPAPVAIDAKLTSEQQQAVDRALQQIKAAQDNYEAARLVLDNITLSIVRDNELGKVYYDLKTNKWYPIPKQK